MAMHGRIPVVVESGEWMNTLLEHLIDDYPPREKAAAELFPLLVTDKTGKTWRRIMIKNPPKYFEVMRECSGSPTPIMNVGEYLVQLFATGVTRADLPVVQPILQHRIWQRMSPGEGPGRLRAVVEELRREDARFHMEGGSWTNDISWVQGYDRVLIVGEDRVHRRP